MNKEINDSLSKNENKWDAKTDYIVKTFSRTKRKDYENYVINVIWNRVDNKDLHPITQQYVYNSKDNQHYFIDLFFPQLMIGIEVNERHHLAQREKDLKRSEAIWYEINKLTVESEEQFKEYIIEVFNKTYDQIEDSINEVVQTIKNKISEKKMDKWIVDREDFLNSKEEITIKDDIVFYSIAETCNMLFNTNYKTGSGGSRKSHFLPTKLYNNSEFCNNKLWFPKLATENEGLFIAVSKGWNNRLNKDGSLIEFNEKNAEKVSSDYENIAEFNEPLRITFAQSTDPLGRHGYRFIGIYKKTKEIAIPYKNEYAKAKYYTRVSDRFNIVKN